MTTQDGQVFAKQAIVSFERKEQLGLLSEKTHRLIKQKTLQKLPN